MFRRLFDHFFSALSVSIQHLFFFSYTYPNSWATAPSENDNDDNDFGDENSDNKDDDNDGNVNENY